MSVKLLMDKIRSCEMEKLEKDMLLVVDEPTAQSYNNGTMTGIDQLLHNVDVISPSMLDDSKIFIDVSGVPINVEIDHAYLRAKYFDDANVYYEATFDSINRMNRERFNMYKRVAHILGATMITKMNVQEEESSLGFGAEFGFAIGRAGGVNANVNGVGIGASFENKKAFKGQIQALIEQKLDRGFLQYEVFDAKEFSEQRWNDAKEELKNSGLYYNEDFRNLLESRNPRNGLKKFDFMQYQISSDLSKYLKLGAAIDFSKIISGGVASVLSGILGIEISLDASIMAQIQNFKRESDLLVIGFEHPESCLEGLDKITEQYKKTRALFGDSRLEKKDVALQLAERGLSLGEISAIAKLPIEEIQQMKNEMDMIYRSRPEKSEK